MRFISTEGTKYARHDKMSRYHWLSVLIVQFYEVADALLFSIDITARQS